MDGGCDTEKPTYAPAIPMGAVVTGTYGLYTVPDVESTVARDSMAD